jgi:ABC-2 type transport system permease protein
MATMSVGYGVSGRRSFGATVRLYGMEIRSEFLKLWRMKSYSLAVIGFPVMFYTLFGIVNRGETMGASGMQATKYLLASYIAFGMIGAALFGIGVGLGSERAQGWLELKRASPMPPMAYLLAKCVTAQAFGMIIAAILMVIAVTLGGAQLSATEVALLFCATAIGTVPFAALGLLVALVVPPTAAPGIVNLIYLPMSFLGGLWIPLRYLPEWLQGFAPAFPTYHLAQLVETIFGYQQPGSVLSQHLFALLGFMLLMLGISWRVWQRAEQDA